MEKLKYEIYNKGIQMEEQLYNQLQNYDEVVVGVVDEKLAALKKEREELQINSNVISIDTDMNVYLENQQRLKELPTLIFDTENERLKAINNKKNYQDKLCKGIYQEIGGEYAAEYNENMQILSNEYKKYLTKMIELHKEMEQLERDYKFGLNTVINTKGVYLTIDKYPYINKIHSEHNIKVII